MRIILGPGYDGRLPNHVKPAINTLICGELGFVEELELRAGIVHKPSSQAARTVRYLHALREADNSDRFYHESLKTDPMACAKELLGWRDNAMLHGWLLKEGFQSNGRLVDLEEVEKHIAGMPPCLAERIYRLFDHMESICLALNSIEFHGPSTLWANLFCKLIDRISGHKRLCEKTDAQKYSVSVIYKTFWVLNSWPYQSSQGIWSTLDSGDLKACWENNSRLTHLAFKRTNLDHEFVIRSKANQANSDLGGLQSAIIEGKPLGCFHNDGSVKFHSTTSQAVAADYLCSEITQNKNHLVIAGDKKQELNSAIVGHGLAEPGLGEQSLWRAPQQLLPALLNICWSPPSAEAVMAYLTMPAGPYTRLRRDIAKQFADLPGLDQCSWQKCIDTYINNRADKEPDLKLDKLQIRISQWLPVATADSDSADCGLIGQLAAQVASYWSQQLTNNSEPEKTPLFAAALGAAQSVSEAINHWPESQISKVQLSRILDVALSESAVAFHYPREISPVNMIEAPECAMLQVPKEGKHNYGGRINQVAYWGLSHEPDQRIPPLSRKELEGLPLLPTEEQRRDFRKACLNMALLPIFQADESVILLQLDSAPNLLKVYLDQVLSCDNWPLLENDLLEGRVPGLRKHTLGEAQLPDIQRWWTVSSEVIPGRNKHSYSSLSSLLLKPHEYVLKYGARLSEGAIRAVSLDNRLKGNLGHKLVECWFQQNSWNGEKIIRSDVSQWLYANFDAIALRYALPMLAPGMQAEKHFFLETMTHSLAKLLEHLYEAGVSEVYVEKKLSQGEHFGELEGTLDLFVLRKNGNWAVVDVKWGSESRYSNELKESRYLQLVTYQRLAKSQGRVDGVAFFILKTGHILARDNFVFPGALVAKPDDEAGIPEQVWLQLSNTLDWRLEQFSSGRIEVTYQDEPDNESAPPDNALDVVGIEAGELKQQNNRYKASFKKVDSWRVLTGQIGE